MRTKDILLVALATLVIFGTGMATGGLLMRNRAVHPASPVSAPDPGLASVSIGASTPGGATGTNSPGNTQATAPAASGLGNTLAAPLFPGRFNTLSVATDHLEDLTPAQRARIQSILRDGREHLADFFLLFEPDIQQVFRKLRDEVRAELTPDQRRRMDEWLKQRPRKAQDRNVTAVGTAVAPR